MITQQFHAVLKKVGAADTHIPVQTRLVFDAESDPYAILVEFQTPDEGKVVWTFAFDLLTDALATPYARVGEGDVRFQYFPNRQAVVICLRSPEGHADVALPSHHVSFFTGRVEAASGVVDCTEQIDSFLAEVLGG